MKRRAFLKNTSLGLIGAGLASSVASTGDSAASSKREDDFSERGFITTEQNRIVFYTDAVTETIRVIHAPDTHLWLNDEREDPFRQYSDRMAAAYNQTRHFQTGDPTHPEEAFEQIIKIAAEADADLIALPGDMVSWPSELAIEWAHEKLESSDVPYLFVAGNHDWHYEGMEGSIDELRSEWIRRRLHPLYQGHNPMMAAYDMKGLRFLAIDNSTYEISDEQLVFFRDQVKSRMPLVLMIHIPMYAPGRPVSYGCGHPDWSAETDRNYIIERRPRWPETGHSRSTMNFYKELFNAPNILGIFAGHIHRQSVEYIHGIPQFVSDANATGAFLDITFHPLSEKDRNLI